MVIITNKELEKARNIEDFKNIKRYVVYFSNSLFVIITIKCLIRCLSLFGCLNVPVLQYKYNCLLSISLAREDNALAVPGNVRVDPLFGTHLI